MTTWTQDELATIGVADELRLASLRRDGSLRKPVTIWVVQHGDDLYVRSYNGRDAAWFRSTQTCREGSIRAGGILKDVTFEEEINPGINDLIDAAYRSKYGHYSASYINQMVSAETRAATIKLVPRATRHSY